jgi:hypothetical protein
MAISKRQEKTHNQAKINGNDVLRRSLLHPKTSPKNKQNRTLQQRQLPPTTLIKKLITKHPPIIIPPPILTNKPNKFPILPNHNKKETPKNLPYPSIT